MLTTVCLYLADQRINTKMVEPRDIEYIVNAHQSYSRSGSKAFRKWDGRTPYHIHPLWCASTIATETTLDIVTREEGILTLLYHDVLEDTTLGLPDWLNERVKHLIGMMTYDGMVEEMKQVWDKPREVRLYKLYDKVNNLLDWQRSSTVKHEKYQEYTKSLCVDVETNFGVLNIIKLAKAVVGESG